MSSTWKSAVVAISLLVTFVAPAAQACKVDDPAFTTGYRPGDLNGNLNDYARIHWDADSASAIIGAHLEREGPLLPILHELQGAFGYIPEAAEPIIAEALNISRAEVHGVVTFYHDFRKEPAGRHVIKLCRAEACQACGGDELPHLKRS